MKNHTRNPPAEWDAETYHRVSAPQVAWGQRALYRLPLSGAETVVDAGCGSGRLTAELLDRLPNGHVFAVMNEITDLSASDDPPFTLDYWRLNLAATRPTAS